MLTCVCARTFACVCARASGRNSAVRDTESATTECRDRNDMPLCK